MSAIYISVERIPEPRLAKLQWDFWFNDSQHRLVLDRWTASQRATRRHGFKAVAYWYRLERRDSRMTALEFVPLPDDIMADAIAQFTRRLTIGKPHDR